jgi:hypothetical protein
MKIIITEDQYKLLMETDMTEDNLYRFLHSLWDKQKKMGEEPHLDDVIYDVTEIRKDSISDYNIIRPIWYEYNGGYDVLLSKIYEEFLDKEFYLEGSENLKMDFKIDNIESYGVDVYGGMVDITCQILDGTVDGNFYNQETEEMEMVPNMTLQDQYAELEYDSGDFEDFLKEEIFIFLEHKFEKYGIPIHVESFV